MLHRLPGWCALLLLVAFLPAGRTGDADWPRFRGPNGAAISEATPIPVRWTETDYNWKVSLPGSGHSSPVLWGRRIFLTCADPASARRTVVCLDAADGRSLWHREYPSRVHGMHRDNSYAAATPAADAGGVVVSWTTPEEVLLLALDTDGCEVWRRELGPFVGLHGSGASPILVGDLVVLPNDQEDPKALPSVYGEQGAAMPSGSSFLIAVDRKTGQTRWQVQRRTSIAAYSTPCVHQPEDGRPELLFTSSAHGMTAVDAATGKVTWEMDDLFKDRCAGSPVLAPGLVIATYGQGIKGSRCVAVRPGSIDKNREPVLVYDIWKSVPLVPTPLVKDGRLFLWGDDGIVTCLRSADGEVIWTERAGGSFYGSPVWVDGRLYAIARSGEVVVLAAADKFEVLARVPLGEASHATPAVAAGVMYLRTTSKLFSLGGPDGAVGQ
jgi:outer membrane protein assembly factor BamB